MKMSCKLARLQREVQLEDANYRKYVDSLEQVRIDRAMATEGKSNISIVQPGTLDMKSIKPKLLTNFAPGDDSRANRRAGFSVCYRHARRNGQNGRRIGA